jgi:hypothetical protein
VVNKKKTQFPARIASRRRFRRLNPNQAPQCPRNA